MSSNQLLSVREEFDHLVGTLNRNTMTPLAVDSQPTPMNAVQINIVLVLDCDRALATGSLEDCLFMTDNAVNGEDQPSRGRGSAHLSTNCNQGMVINWVVYAVGGTIIPQITAIEFLDRQVMEKLQVYGAPCIPLSPAYIPGVTPWYAYWAGIVLPDIPAGIYPYRLDIALCGQIFSATTPSLNVSEIGTVNIAKEIARATAPATRKK